MADSQDSGQEKTLAPSQRRLDQARSEGRVARSRDLSGAIATIACVSALILGGAGIAQRAMGWMQSSFRAAGAAAVVHDDRVLLQSLHSVLFDGLLAIAPVVAAGMIAGVLGSVGLGGLVLSFKALEPDFGKLSPLAGLGRILSAQGLAELGKSILKVVLLGSVATLLIWNGAQGWMNLILPALPQALAELSAMIARHALILAACLFLIAGADVPLQWWNHHKKLRMTLEEAKEEGKETEGNPQIKGRIRQLQRERARARMMQAVPGADVVVTNPTHYAVALKYDEQRMAAPRLVAKGVDGVAARIRELAGQHKVAMVESPRLARALYRHGELDREVPVALYRAVAQVLAYVYQLRDYVSGPPPQLQAVEVPDGWDPLDAAPLGRGGRA